VECVFGNFQDDWHSRKFADPLWRSDFCLNVITTDPCLIARDNLLRERFVTVCAVWQLLTDVDAIVFPILRYRPRDKFCRNAVHFKLFYRNRMTRTDRNVTICHDFSNCKRLLERTISSHEHRLVDVDGRPERGSSSTDSRPSFRNV